MARRNGKPGDYLITDDYLGVTTYASKVTTDFWGNVVQKPLLRNLQEIATPLNDPYPVPLFRGPDYEQTIACQFEIQPQYIGRTTRPFPNTQLTQLLDLNPSLGSMFVGCTFRVF